MSPPSAHLRLIREALEGVIAPALIDAVLRDALVSYGGKMPDAPHDVMRLVQGPLRDVLARRVGHQEALAVVTRLVPLLGRSEPSAPPRVGPPPLPSQAPATPATPIQSFFPPVRARDSTASIPVGKEPVTVMVVAQSRGIVEKIAAALGADGVAPYAAGTIEKIERSMKLVTPALVVIDASDFPSIDPLDLARALAPLPTTTTRALFGPDLPYGGRVSESFDRVQAPYVKLDRREGLDPLLDMIRARRSAT